MRRRREIRFGRSGEGEDHRRDNVFLFFGLTTDIFIWDVINAGLTPRAKQELTPVIHHRDAALSFGLAKEELSKGRPFLVGLTTRTIFSKANNIAKSAKTL